MQTIICKYAVFSYQPQAVCNPCTARYVLTAFAVYGIKAQALYGISRNARVCPHGFAVYGIRHRRYGISSPSCILPHLLPAQFPRS